MGYIKFAITGRERTGLKDKRISKPRKGSAILSQLNRLEKLPVRSAGFYPRNLLLVSVKKGMGEHQNDAVGIRLRPPTHST